MRKKSVLLAAVLVLFIISGVSAAAAQALVPMADIILEGSTASSAGGGVRIDGSAVTITKAGRYTLSGILSNGQIIVDTGKDDTVELVLDGVSVTSAYTAAIYAKQAKQLIITLTDDSENILSSAADFNDAPGAVLFSQDDLCIRGGGTLSVYGSRQIGIETRDNLLIEGGDIAIEAGGHGIRGKDSVTVQGGTVSIIAEGDGIRADHDADQSGTVWIREGVIHITAKHDGIQAVSTLTIDGGTISILAGGGHAAAGTLEESHKALKAEGTVTVSGGVLEADSLDDAIHAKQAIHISGGILTLASGDDGMHADGTVSITGGTIAIAPCYEGLESADVDIAGGSLYILSEDDGINAVDSVNHSRENASLQVNISGGVTGINAYGDGIDSNGIVTMTGGQLLISGPSSSASGALDYDTDFRISGGTLAASGSIGMAQMPGADSLQPSVMVVFAMPQQAGSIYVLADDSGSVLISFMPEKQFQCIVFSVPQLVPGRSYQLYESSDGTLDNAELLYDFRISDTITVLDD